MSKRSYEMLGRRMRPQFFRMNGYMYGLCAIIWTVDEFSQLTFTLDTTIPNMTVVMTKNYWNC